MALQNTKKSIDSHHQRRRQAINVDNRVGPAVAFGKVPDASLEYVVAIKLDQHSRRIRNMHITNFEMYPMVSKLHGVLDPDL
jgi:hypothetical protein